MASPNLFGGIRPPADLLWGGGVVNQEFPLETLLLQSFRSTPSLRDNRA